MTMLKRLRTRFPDLPIAVVTSDVEPSLGNKWQKFSKKEGITWDPSAPYVKEQNGGSERSGQMIIYRARILYILARLPKNLWPEYVKAAADLLNLTSIRSIDWQSPLGLLYKTLGLPLPSLAHLKTYGCKCYVLDQHVAQGDKLQERAFVGYLVGYDSTNIFRVWVPHSKKVIRVRDVRFDETKRYDPRDPDLSIAARKRIDEIVEIIEIPEPPDGQLSYVENEITDLLEGGSLSTNGSDDTRSKPTEPMSSEPVNLQLQTPEPTPEPTHPIPPAPLPASGSPIPTSRSDEQFLQNLEQVVNTNPDIFPNSSQLPSTFPGPSVPARGGGTTTVSADPHPGLIIEGPRTRQSTRRAAYNATLDGGLHEMDRAFKNVYTSFSSATKSLRWHQNNIPPPPEKWKDLKSHPLGPEFIAATKLEWSDVGRKGTYAKVPRVEAQGKKVLPLRWVFVYKFDSEGFLLKCKARICVRGDLQTVNDLDTRATTLAARVFRALMSLVAAFDLETAQLDSVNAFLNSSLDEEIYCELPEGFNEEGHCLRLKRALYGLRRSPILWQQEFSGTLKNLGLKQIPEEPCLFTNGRIIVFFYVDDIVLLARKEFRDEMLRLKAELMKKYEMRDLGELQWFLNIRVIRDRQQRKLWLCQDAYIDKIVKTYNHEHSAKAATPLSVSRKDLIKFDGQADPQYAHAYQRRIGSVIYLAVITRPDIALAVSLLAVFLANPSPRHRAEADRIICYLRDTKYLAIEYSADGINQASIKTYPHETRHPVFEACSDAAFGDDPDTRRSSEGFLFRLFGGPVDWKATRQPHVTTSTTEAELLSLSHATRSLIWWNRLFKQMDFNTGHEAIIHCDNVMTTRHIMNPVSKINTKLQHVDIQNHWLRELAGKKEIKVEWIPTAEMPADGLTKPLERQRHLRFVELLGLRDIRYLVDTKNPDELA